MNQQTRNVLITVIALVVIVVLGYFAWRERTEAPAPSVATSTSATSTGISLSVSSSSAITSQNPAYTVTNVPISKSNSPTPPDYKTPLSCASTVPADQCAQFQAQAATYQTQIGANVQNLSAWINLGTVREEAGDYTGAEAAWKYVTQVYPTSPTAFDNLGDLYLNYLHEYAQADADYQIAIKLYPADPNPYEALFTMYTTTSYTGGANAAVNILKQGITANPKAVNLEVTLARYYKSQGNTAAAQAEYQIAIQNAQSQGLTSLSAQIEQEANGQ